MLIELIIEFELLGPGPPEQTCIPTSAYFHDKRKNFNENLQVDWRQSALHPPACAKSLTKVSTKMKDLKRVLDSKLKEDQTI